MSVTAFLRDQLRRRAGASRHLRALAGTKFDVVNRRAERNIFQRQRVADEDVRFGTGHNGHADLQSNRLKDVAVLAVGVAQQSDKRRTIRIVLDRFDLGGNADLVAPEIDNPIMLLVAAAAMAHRQSGRSCCGR